MKRIRLVAVIVLILAVAAAGIWWLARPTSSQAENEILTSGFIEGRDVAISAESSGSIVEINYDEGEQVVTGDTLVRLDDSELKARQAQAQADIQFAEASLAQAQAAQDGARKMWEDAQDVLNNPLELDARVLQAQGEVESAKRALKFTGQTPYKTAVQTAQNILDNLLKIREHPQDLIAAVDQTYSNYQVSIAQVAASQAKLAQSQAAAAIIEIEIDDLTVSAPSAGVVVSRNAEVGEIAQPGATLLTLTRLDEVTLTAYVPESDLGLVKIGQTVEVMVDSYPDETFNGTVTYISPEAQFTPKNVQLKSERETTVFAVKIQLDNADFKLKPGMPADARILVGG
jgi:HlyD family secretion protein